MKIDNIEFEELNKESKLFTDDIEKSVITIAEIIYFFLQKKIKILISFILLTAVCSYLFLSVPDFYIAKTTFIPPSSNVISTYSDSLSAATASTIDLSSRMIDPNAILIQILKSRLVREPIIKKLNLISVFKSKDMEGALKDLDTASTFRSNGGLLEIEISWKEPELTTSIANEYANSFAVVLSDLSTVDIKKGKKFLEKRLVQVHDKLILANKKLNEFKLSKKMVDVDLQKGQIIGNVVDIKNRIMNLEIELSSLNATYTDKSQRVKNVKAQINALNEKLNEKMNKNISLSTATTNNDKDVVSFYDIPALTIDYSELSRDVGVLDQIYSTLHREYEFVKIREAKEAFILKIVDKAVVPNKKANIPNYGKIGIIALMSLIIVLGFVFIQYSLTKINNFSPENYRIIAKLKSDIKKELVFWK